jgi:hypothetical protein
VLVFDGGNPIPVEKIILYGFFMECLVICILDVKILFMKKMTLSFLVIGLSFIALGQKGKVQMFGKILDKDMKPIANVSVVLKGTKYKTTTNGEGVYSFNLPPKKGTVIFSHEGYATKESEFTGTPQATDLVLVEDKVITK